MRFTIANSRRPSSQMRGASALFPNLREVSAATVSWPRSSCMPYTRKPGLNSVRIVATGLGGENTELSLCCSHTRGSIVPRCAFPQHLHQCLRLHPRIQQQHELRAHGSRNNLARPRKIRQAPRARLGDERAWGQLQRGPRTGVGRRTRDAGRRSEVGGGGISELAGTRSRYVPAAPRAPPSVSGGGAYVYAHRVCATPSPRARVTGGCR